MMTSRKMIWVGHVAFMRERRGVYRVLVEKPEERDHLEGPGIVWRIILRWIFREWVAWTRLTWLRKGTGGWLL
jgi:hypothetical protein